MNMALSHHVIAMILKKERMPDIRQRRIMLSFCMSRDISHDPIIQTSDITRIIRIRFHLILLNQILLGLRGATSIPSILMVGPMMSLLLDVGLRFHPVVSLKNRLPLNK